MQRVSAVPTVALCSRLLKLCSAARTHLAFPRPLSPCPPAVTAKAAKKGKTLAQIESEEGGPIRESEVRQGCCCPLQSQQLQLVRRLCCLLPQRPGGVESLL